MSPQAEPRAPFDHTARVRFYQADPAGVLFYGRIFELVNDAYEELVRAAGIAFDDHFALRDTATPVVHVAADYRRPILAGEDVTVRLEVARLGTSSLHLDFAVLGPEGELRASGQVIHVFVDARTFAKVDVPERVREALAPFVAAP